MENIEVFHRGFYEENVACASPYIACLFENSPMDPQLKTIIRSLLYYSGDASLQNSQGPDLTFATAYQVIRKNMDQPAI